MAEETKFYKFGNWVRENARGIAIAGVFGMSGLFVGYAINNNAQQNRAYRQDIIGVLEKVVQQDPNQAKVLADVIKPKEPVKEEANEIKKEAKEMTQEKYIRVLEEHRGLRKGNDALTAERNALMQKYDALSKEQAPLQQKYAKTLEDLTATSKLKEQLEVRQKELVKQVADVNEVAVKLTGENNKLNRSYVAEAEARKKSDANSVEVTAKLTDLDKKYMQLLEEKAKLDKEIVEKYAPALDSYNIFFRQRGISKPAESAESRRPRVESEKATEETKYGLLALQVGAIKRSKEAAIVFLKGNLTELDRKKSDFFERTDGSSVEEIVNRFSEESERYALLTDTNDDGILDIVYKKGKKGTFNLKEGKKDGTFAPTKTVSSEFYYEVLKKCVNKGLGFD